MQEALGSTTSNAEIGMCHTHSARFKGLTELERQRKEGKTEACAEKLGAGGLCTLMEKHRQQHQQGNMDNSFHPSDRRRCVCCIQQQQKATLVNFGRCLSVGEQS